MELTIVLGIMSCYITGNTLWRYLTYKERKRESVMETVFKSREQFKKENNFGD